LVFVLLAGSVLSQCASTPPIASDQTTQPRAASAASAIKPAACANVRQAAHTFIGFAADQALDDFDATALQATRVLSAIKLQLCRLAPEQDPAGGLRAALVASGAEIKAVHFTSAQLLLAHVDVQTGEPDAGRAWLVQVQRAGETWRVLSAAAK
jgi:hypothetical protein